jgi:hypothetical protein
MKREVSIYIERQIVKDILLLRSRNLDTYTTYVVLVQHGFLLATDEKDKRLREAERERSQPKHSHRYVDYSIRRVRASRDSIGGSRVPLIPHLAPQRAPTYLRTAPVELSIYTYIRMKSEE